MGRKSTIFGMVVGIRLLFFAAALTVALGVTAITAVVDRLTPDVGSTRSLPRLHIRRRLASVALELIPSRFEHIGGITLLLRTKFGLNHIDRLADASPRKLVTVWGKFAVGTMYAMLAIWSLLLAGIFAVLAATMGVIVYEIAAYAVSLEWVALFTDTGAGGGIDVLALLALIPENAGLIAAALLSIVIAAVATSVFTWVGITPLLPGLALHEFGHYFAVRASGESVDSIGVLFLGTAIGGAFVDPTDRIDLLPYDDQYVIWSGGIANTVLWASLLLIVGIVLGGGEPLMHALNQTSTGPLWVNPIASGIIFLGVVELANGFLNAYPFGPVDGGGFSRTLEREFWGFDKAINEEFTT